MAQKPSSGRPTWPQLEATNCHKNIHVYAIAITNVLKQFKEKQRKTGNSLPKSVFLPLVEGIIDFAERVVETPLLKIFQNNLRKIKNSIQKQANQQLQIVKTVNTISARPTTAIPNTSPPRLYIDAAR